MRFDQVKLWLRSIDIGIWIAIVAALVVIFCIVVSINFSRYKIVEIDGMPCIVSGNGITCDWSQWQGQQHD